MPAASESQLQKPIIVKIIQPPKDPTGISDAIIQAIGLTGAITLLAIVCGVVIALVLFWSRWRHGLRAEPPPTDFSGTSGNSESR